MPSLKSLARRASDRAFGTAFDRALARAHRDSRQGFLFFWNRGLGDIALGLVPLFLRIRGELTDARIAVITREELRDPFMLAGVDALHVLPGLERESRIDIAAACATLGLDARDFGTILSYPDPNRWLEGRRREFPPKLVWNAAWDPLAAALDPPSDRVLVGAHVNSETARYYGYRKDWPAESWRELLARFPGDSVHWVLLGYAPDPPFAGANITDLRGRTDFPTLMSLVRNRLRMLVAPDSGILTMAYYLDANFPLDLVSLWSDPRQGVLRQECISPNAMLKHTPLVAPEEDLRKLSVDAVERALSEALRSRPR